ncbi:hypothetical protein DPMN_014730 [Dreissena polymorpha]|uniref:Uncharacterized protein n=1 Tax=Dreissena polymorpha TaxID=45954 RepID=A0A9D4N7W0_DREPO|nr:hypothetical protein DPMN_014730 [Dreissena polymorpha]
MTQVGISRAILASVEISLIGLNRNDPGGHLNNNNGMLSIARRTTHSLTPTMAAQGKSLILTSKLYLSGVW